VNWSPPAAELGLCSLPVSISVPLKGGLKKGKKALKMQTLTSVPAGKKRGIKDRDTLILTCLSPQL